MGCFISELRTMSSSEFTSWSAYAKVEPFGVQRDDWHHARTQSLLYNAHKSSKSKSLTPNDFMLTRQKPKKSQDDMLKYLTDNLRLMAKRNA